MTQSMTLKLRLSRKLSAALIARPHYDHHRRHPVTIVVTRSCQCRLRDSVPAVQRHVSLQVVALRERSTADATDKRTLPAMDPHVSSKIRLLRERSPAQLAFERSFARMCTYMRLQHAVVGKRPPTHDADKAAPIGFIRVGIVATHVLVEVTALRK